MIRASTISSLKKTDSERWRTARWDSLVATACLHDRFPAQEFAGIAVMISPPVMRSCAISKPLLKTEAPVRCVLRHTVTRSGAGGFVVETLGQIDAQNVAATGPFQTPVIPVIPETAHRNKCIPVITGTRMSRRWCCAGDRC